MGAKHHDFYDSEGTLLKSFTGSCSSNREVGSLQEVCGFCLILIVLPYLSLCLMNSCSSGSQANIQQLFMPRLIKVR